ncbi:MAG: hypothetical protein II804_05980 [Clostridia bacterium]|jgi:hypothetical protein|nr:hypothetical protein [Clostridia bacterium]
MESILAFFVKILKLISGILTATDDEALGWIFGKGAELLDENKDKIVDGANQGE